MKCPECKEEILFINVISECWQKGTVNKKGKIINYGSVEDVLKTIKIEHRNGKNNCLADITNLIRE